MAMNKNQIKTKILILRTVDTVLVIALMVAGIYSVLYADNKETMLVACFIGLLLLNRLGRMTNNKIALLRVQLGILMRDMKREEQATLMRTRHTMTRATKNTAIKTNPTIKK